MFDAIVRYAVQATPPFPAPPTPPPQGLFDQLLAFVYTTAHWVGELIVKLLTQIVPLHTPVQLIDPIGYLALLTVLLLVAEVAKKIVWIIVLVGWLLIIIRIILEVIRST